MTLTDVFIRTNRGFHGRTNAIARRGERAACYAMFTAGLLAAPGVHAAEGGADGASQTCMSSGECGAPEPYCHPVREVCVECLSDANCVATTGTCNIVLGTCVLCMSDEQCGGEHPYCSDENNRCVECLTDENCASKGLVCQNGHCGFCGDGFCSEREQHEAAGTCAEDCFAECPEFDLGSELGTEIASGTTPAGDRSHGYFACGGTEGAERTFSWSAPSSGTYSIRTRGGTVLAVIYGRCSGPLAACGSESSPVRLLLGEGQNVVLVVDSASAAGATYSIDIEREADPFGDGGPASGPEQCLAEAVSRGDVLCDEGTRCACNRCPAYYDLCATTDGCVDIVRCMDEQACVEEQCARASACGSLIEQHGGLSGSAYGRAAILAACARASLCELTCSLPDAGSGEGSVSIQDGAADARGELDSAAVDGAFGGADASFHGDARTVDGGRAGNRPDDGCGCTIPGRRLGPTRIAALLALLGSIVIARARKP